jgi:hypothetical protein
MSRRTSAFNLPQVSGAGADVVAFRMLASGRGPALALRQRMIRAGEAVAAHICDAFDTFDLDTAEGRARHAATVTGVLATLAAECALRAAETQSRAPLVTAADGWVVGAPADGLLFRNGETYAPSDGFAPTVLDIVAEALLDCDPGARLPNLDQIVALAESHMGAVPFPIVTTPAPWRPQALLRAAAARHRTQVAALSAECGFLMQGEVALVLGEAIGLVLRHSEAPGVVATIAAEVAISAARLAPLAYAIN